MIVACIAVIGYVNGSTDERIDRKLSTHEAEFEMKQQAIISEIKQDVATLTEQGVSHQRQLDVIQEQGKQTQELVVQIIRDR